MVLNNICKYIFSHIIHNLFLSIFLAQIMLNNVTAFTSAICIGCAPAGCTAVQIVWCLEGRLKKNNTKGYLMRLPSRKSQFCSYHLLFQFHSKKHACLVETHFTKHEKVSEFTALLAKEARERVKVKIGNEEKELGSMKETSVTGI